MALTKLVLSILFILLLIPLIVRLLPSSQHVRRYPVASDR